MGYSFIPFSMSPFPPTCRQKEPDMQRERAGTHGGLISVDRRAGLVKSQPRLLCLAFALVRYSIFALVPRQKRDLSLMHYIQHLTLESALPSLRKYSQPRSVRHKQLGLHCQRWEFIKENKKGRKHASDQEIGQEKR